MRKLILSSLLTGAMLTLGVSMAGAYTIDLTAGKGDTDTWNGARFTEFTDAMQFTVSSGTGVIDPFLTMQKKPVEEGFNSDYTPLVLDTTRPMWNHSIQISDLSGLDPLYYDFLLDLNEPNGNKSLLTQHELEIYVVPYAVGGDISDYAALGTEGTLIWDLDGPEDSSIVYDYDIWNGSGQNFDALTEIQRSLFSGYSADDYVYLYAQFGQLAPPPADSLLTNHKSEDGFEEYALREGGEPVPEPATMLLFGIGLAGLVGLRGRGKEKG